MWEKTLGSVQMLNVAVNNLTDAIALVQQLHPGAIIEEQQCSEYYNAGDLTQLRDFPHHFRVWGWANKADADAASEFVRSNGESTFPDPLQYIVMRRVMGSGVHYAALPNVTT